MLLVCLADYLATKPAGCSQPIPTLSLIFYSSYSHSVVLSDVFDYAFSSVFLSLVFAHPFATARFKGTHSLPTPLGRGDITVLSTSVSFLSDLCNAHFTSTKIG